MTTKKRRKITTMKALEEILDFTPIEDPPTKSMSRSKGRRSSLGVRLFIWNLFQLNENLPKSKKLTNVMLEKNIREEFSNRPSLLTSMDSGRQGVNWWRLLFNTGQLLNSKGTPPVISLRYNHHGDPVDSRTGNKELHEADIVELCRKYGIEDARFTG
jgi:hypothetical protein